MSEREELAREAALRERVARLPRESGVYVFRDASGQVLYVGKAQDLRSRVRSYFSRSGDGRPRMHFLLPRIRDFEVVVTANVKEALLLENQLIKKHRPRFNIRLRDDKNYLGLRLDPREPYPRFTEIRRFKKDGATYFGPYTSSASLRNTLDTLQKLFPLRTCSDTVLATYRRKGRPCLEHAMGRCAAPCCERISDATYRDLVDGAVLFLRGRTGDLVRSLRQRMKQAAAGERFEEAARLRDRLEAIERTVESQAMVSTRQVDRDVFGLAREGERVEIQVLHVRQGKLLGGSPHGFRDVRIDEVDALGSVLAQFYDEDRDIPREILLPFEVEGMDTFEELWRERAGRAVRIVVPRRGARRRLVQMAQRNAEVRLSDRRDRDRGHAQALEALRERLRLPTSPRRIECYDVSHLQGAVHVGSRVVFVDGRPDKQGYRRYRIRGAGAGDDYAAIREVLSRRLERLGEDPAPDLLLLDGGKGQLNAARAALEDAHAGGIPLAAISKEREDGPAGPRVRRHGGLKREKVFLPNVKDPIRLSPDSHALLLLQRIRDESHRFAIAYHRSLRSKRALRSVLDDLPGIGPVKRRALLRAMGSLRRVREATKEELARVPKLTTRDAAVVHRLLRRRPSGARRSPPGSPGRRGSRGE